MTINRNDELEFYYPDKDAEADIHRKASAEKNYEENKENKSVEYREFIEKQHTRSTKQTTKSELNIW